MASLAPAKCDHDVPCTCIMHEGTTYKGMESIIDALVEERDNLLSYIDTLEKQQGYDLL